MKVRDLCAAAAVALAVAAPSYALADNLDAEAGYLRCDVSAGVSFIFGSTRDVTCTYDPADGSKVQYYSGSIERYGIDIGYMKSSVMLWGVLTAGAPVPQGGLAGSYAGVSAEVAAGYGVGANVLLLGDESLALQPLSIEGGEGLNLAAGIAALTLKAE
jgi:Protein of unknown function (DUF992)